MSSMTPEKLQHLLEAAMMAYGKPMSIEKLESLFEEDKRPSKQEIREALTAIAEACENRGVELKEVASGFRFQAKQDFAEWISRLWEEKPPRYSRALLETLALIAYRQPITRSEIEEVRGVSVSSHIIKTLLEREWVRVVGHRDVPGRPALYATTKDFLDYFNLKSLEELPTLSEIRDLDQINAELDLGEGGEAAKSSNELGSSDAAAAETATVESASGTQAESVDDSLNQEMVDDAEVLESGEGEAQVEEPMEDELNTEKKALDHEGLSEPDERSLAEQARDAEVSDSEIVEAVELADESKRQADDSVFNDAFEPESHENHEQSNEHETSTDSSEDDFSEGDESKSPSQQEA